ncbi:MAG: hypothetical protein H6708_11905 [Kofleriaceae bacterium]|nr:hypothetical protein [Kofleriaceae bacterium]
MRRPTIAAVASAVVVVAALVTLTRPAAAQQEPTGAHPRLFLDDALRATWKRQAGQKGTAVARAVRGCDELRKHPKDHARDLYMGLDWAHHLQTCLVAWAATGADDHAKTAMVYFRAMLDDLEVVGDGKGGDEAARRDSGFAIRAMGPYTALAYDWLHDRPEMTEDLRATARQRFAAWTTWYAANGYRARSPGTNYHAGYLVAITLIAIAQGGEAGRAGARMWGTVVDELWGKDMAKALAPGGLLDGGDWGEGWQYGPLSVAEYALAARALAEQGAKIDAVGTWLAALLRHNVHALSPGDGMFVAGDTQNEQPNQAPGYLAFAAPLVGDADADTWAWSRDELAQLGLTSSEFPLFEALAEARAVAAAPVPRASWPTSYLARGVGNFYSRSKWGQDGVWMVAQCSSTIDVDHRPANAGNFVLSRGRDDVIVDPSPYGSLSSLTSNAPTVESAQLPDDYKPSQAYWSERTGFPWARQSASGIVAARCDYADQYKFQDRPSDVPAAVRDLVLVPYHDGADAALVVIDRAQSGDAARALYLRFKVPGTLALAGDVAQGKVGHTQVAITRVAASGGTAEVRARKKGDCFGEGTTRGGCDIPRFEVDEYRLIPPGPQMSAIHVIDVSAATKAAPVVTPIAGVDGVLLERDGRRAVVIAAAPGATEVRYQAPRGAAVSHVVAGAPAAHGQSVVSATASGDGCAVTVAARGAGTTVDAAPVMIVLDDACAITEDPTQTGGTAGATIRMGDRGFDGGTGAGPGDDDGGDDDGPFGPPTPKSARSGCCGAQAAPGSALAMSAVVLLGLLAMRRRR